MTHRKNYRSTCQETKYLLESSIYSSMIFYQLIVEFLDMVITLPYLLYAIQNKLSTILLRYLMIFLDVQHKSKFGSSISVDHGVMLSSYNCIYDLPDPKRKMDSATKVLHFSCW